MRSKTGTPPLIMECTQFYWVNENEMRRDLEIGDLAWARAITKRPPTAIVRIADIPHGIHEGDETSRDTNTIKKLDQTPNNMLMYRAYRDCLAPKTRTEPIPGIWRADLVAYEGTPITNGEPCRSIGHWNPPEQVEAFEVLNGFIIMLVVDPNGNIQALDCNPGETWILPAGSFHITYAMQASIILNIYNSTHLSSDQEKYVWKKPPDFGLMENDGSFLLRTTRNDKYYDKYISDFLPSSCKKKNIRLRFLHFANDFEMKSVFEI